MNIDTIQVFSIDSFKGCGCSIVAMMTSCTCSTDTMYVVTESLQDLSDIADSALNSRVCLPPKVRQRFDRHTLGLDPSKLGKIDVETGICWVTLWCTDIPCAGRRRNQLFRTVRSQFTNQVRAPRASCTGLRFPTLRPCRRESQGVWRGLLHHEFWCVGANERILAFC